MSNTEITCDTGNVRNKADMRHRGITRMKMMIKKKRKTKESNGRKETHELN